MVKFWLHAHSMVHSVLIKDLLKARNGKKLCLRGKKGEEGDICSVAMALPSPWFEKQAALSKLDLDKEDNDMKTNYCSELCCGVVLITDLN